MRALHPGHQPAGERGVAPRPERRRRRRGPAAAADLDRQGQLLGLVTVVVVTALDIGIGHHANFAAAVVVAPVLTATVAGPRQVGVVSVTALVATAGLAFYDRGAAAPNAIRELLVLVGALAAGWIAHRRRVRDDQYHQVQHVAEVAQQALLTPLPDRLGPAALAGWYVSATEEALVGGDFYEAIAYKDQVRWILGDVKGKGIDALRLSAVALGAFREAGDSLDSITEVAARLDHRLVHHLGDEDFVTAVVAELHLDGTLTLVNCGHHPPLRLTAGDPQVLTSGRHTTPLGLNPVLRPEAFALEPGDAVWFFTDGVLEGRIGARRGVDLQRLGHGLGGAGAAGAATAIRRRLQATLAGHFDDDTAVLVVQYAPGGS